MYKMDNIKRNVDAALANPYVSAIAYISVFVLANKTMNNTNQNLNSLLTSNVGRFVIYFFAAYIGSKNLTVSVVLALALVFYMSVQSKESFNSNPQIVEVVMYYTEWCGHSKKALPEYEKLESQYQNNPSVKVTKKNCEDDSGKAECKKQDVKGFPTIKTHHSDGSSKVYTGERTAAAIHSHIQAHNSGKAAAAVPAAGAAKANGSDLGKTDRKHKFVTFYAPWCGHCKKMLPVWKQLEQQHTNNPNVEILSVDCVARKDVAEKYGIKGFPTIIVFSDGVKSDYTGGRDLDSFNQHVATLN